MTIRVEEEWRDFSREFQEIRNPETKAVALALDQQMKRWFTDVNLWPDEQALVRAMKVSGSSVPIAACYAMCMIAQIHFFPVEFATRIFQAAPAKARGWMMRFCHAPREAHRAIIELALIDRSKVVREWACEGIASGEHCDLIPRLRELARNDPVPDVRSVAAESADHLEQAFHLASSDAEGWLVSVRRTRTLTEYVSISHEDVKSGRIVDAVTRELGGDLPPPVCPCTKP